MDIKKTIIAGIVAGIVIEIVSLISDFLVQVVWPYNVLELGGMRAMNDPILMLFFLHPWILGLALAIIYPHIKLTGNYIQKGKKFGLLMWLVSSLPSAFIVYTSMNYPLGFIVNSVVGSFLYMLAAGIAIAKLME